MVTEVGGVYVAVETPGPGSFCRRLLNAQHNAERAPPGILEIGRQKLAAGSQKLRIKDWVVEAYSACEGRMSKPRAAAKCRRYQPIRGDAVSGPA